jgi:RNA polymerase sigma-70 factor, ECF subfamily
MTEDDCGLMLRYAGGDLQAFAALYSRHRSALYRYLVRHVREAPAADDLFQEVWSRVIAHRASYQPRAKFSTFLYRIAHNCCVDYRRRASIRLHRPAYEEDMDESGQPALCAPERDLPEARAEQAELLARYRAALDRLPSEQRDVFLLYEQSGLTLEEIAAVTGVGAETAKSRLRYALSKLRRALSAPSPAPDPVPSRAAAAPSPGAAPAPNPSPGTRAARDRPDGLGALPIAQIVGESGS